MFKSLFKPTIPTIPCKQQPRWSNRFLTLLKTPEESDIKGMRRLLYVRDYQDRLVALDMIVQQGDAAIPLLIEALRDPYGDVRTKAAEYLQRFDQPEAHRVLQVLRYRDVKHRKTLKGHEAGIISVAISPDDRFIISTSGEAMICLWDMATGALIKQFEAPEAGISSAIFSADGRYLFSNHRSAAIWQWDMTTGEVVRQFQGHTDRITSLTLASTGRNLISGSWDGTVGVWDIIAGKLIHKLAGHQGKVYATALSRDGETIFSGGDDGTIRWWQRQVGAPLKIYQLGKTIVHSLATHPTQSILLSGDQQVRLSQWDYATGEHLDTLPSWTYRPIHAIAPTPDGEVVLQTCGHGINVWHQPTGWFVHTLVHHRWAVTTLAVSHDGQTIVSGSDDKTIKIWR
jgi:WD40 repeat protein